MSLGSSQINSLQTEVDWRRRYQEYVHGACITFAKLALGFVYRAQQEAILILLLRWKSMSVAALHRDANHRMAKLRIQCAAGQDGMAAMMRNALAHKSHNALCLLLVQRLSEERVRVMGSIIRCIADWRRGAAVHRQLESQRGSLAVALEQSQAKLEQVEEELRDANVALQQFVVFTKAQHGMEFQLL